MLWTLQSYIFREMGKTFLLTAIGLIGVIGLGGGVLNMVELEGVGALQLLKIIGLILPVAATLTLPIAALYAATVTYGRLSADNELVACRSGGINIHVLFLPTLVISMVSAALSFYFISFVIPTMIRNLDRYVGDDLPRIIKQQLSSSDRFSIGDRFVIYADDTELEQPEDGEPVLRLTGVAFSESEDESWKLFGTAESILIAFGHEGNSPTLGAVMYGLRVYDGERKGFADEGRQPIGKSTIPRKLPAKVKWLTLGGLLDYGKHPDSFPSVQDKVASLRGGIARGEFFKALAKEFTQRGEVRFGDDLRTITIRSQRCQVDAEDKRPTFIDQVLITERVADGTVRTIRADSANVDVRQNLALEALQIDVDASGKVTVTNSRASDAIITRDREKLEPIVMPRRFVEQVQAISADELLDPGAKPLGLGSWVAERREDVIQGLQSLRMEIVSELHGRFAFSVSVFVLVILGAALGIVFRGSQVLVAFGISFVPSLFVITMIIMGKQLIEKPDMMWPGISVLWAGIVLVALVDLFVMTKVLRR